ncbi:hypothetical protein Tco_0585504 [Tanacetum coccineum]
MHAAPAGGKIYAGNLPKCNWCNLHHHGPCPQKCQRCQDKVTWEKECRKSRPSGCRNDYAAKCDMFRCGEKGPFPKISVLKAGNQQNDRVSWESATWSKVEAREDSKKSNEHNILRQKVVSETGLPKLEEHNFKRKLLSDEKFCLLKARVKQWHSETKTLDRVTKHDNLQLIKSIEEKIKAGTVNDNDRDSRIKLLQEVGTLDTLESFDLFPKARILLKEKFKNHDSNVDFPPFANSSGLCALNRDSLETPVSLDEVKNAVGICSLPRLPTLMGSLSLL